MLDARGVEHAIETIQHGHVQCIRPGYTGLRNYRRRELKLLLGASDDEESRSSASERGQEDFVSESTSNQEVNLAEEEVAGEGQARTASMRRYITKMGHVRAGTMSALGGAPWRPSGPETGATKRTWKETLGWNDGLSLSALT